MGIKLIFVGSKFIYNESLSEYVVRKVKQKCDFVESIRYFKDKNNSLFLELEEELNSSSDIVIVSTKQNFSTIGKVISTITDDNQIVKENMLIPSKSEIFEDGSYLLKYNKIILNVLQLDEMQVIPEILIKKEISKYEIHIFEEDRENILLMLNPFAQTFDVEINATPLVDGWVKINIEGSKYGNISKFIDASKQLLPTKLISTTNVVKYIIKKLDEHSKKITFAESCTGGLLSSFFTKENGASKILDGSLVTYSNDLKENWLAVEHKILEENGAVSFAVVEEMSEGAISVSNADFALSVSGIAGDGGGSVEKPVGTVFIGVRTKTTHTEEHLIFKGDRNYVQYQSCLYALKMLILSDKKIFF